MIKPRPLMQLHAPHIPHFHVKVRHPVVGWQVVCVGTFEDCLAAYHGWVTKPDWTVSIYQISGWQSWSILSTHEGTHGYER